MAGENDAVQHQRVLVHVELHLPDNGVGVVARMARGQSSFIFVQRAAVRVRRLHLPRHYGSGDPGGGGEVG